MRGDGLDPEAVVAFAIILFLVLAAVIAGYLILSGRGAPIKEKRRRGRAHCRTVSRRDLSRR